MMSEHGSRAAPYGTARLIVFKNVPPFSGTNRIRQNFKQVELPNFHIQEKASDLHPVPAPVE
jgi:hypothetical protein